MALLLLCKLVLLSIVSCQTQNSTDQIQIESTEPRISLINQNITEDVKNTTIAAVSETITDSYVNNDENDGSYADDLADYITKNWDFFKRPTSDKNAVPRVPSEEDLQNCSLPDVLNRYCEDIPNDVQVYFKFGLSVKGILASIFKPDIVETLQSNCTYGIWCLPESFHEDVKQTKTQFFLESPFCSNAMWSCLKNMQNKRQHCGEKNLDYLANTVFLLCNLESLEYLSQECYARTMEALYVTFVNMTQPDNLERPDIEESDCNNFNVWMTKTYLCVDDVCNFDQNMELEKFEPWVPIAKNAVDVAATCNISRSCQSAYESDIGDTSFPFGYYDYTAYDNYNEDEYDEDSDSYEESNELEEELENELEELEEEESKVDDSESVDDNYTVGSDETGNEDEVNTHSVDETGNADEVNKHSNGGYDEQDRSMMLGLIVMTTSLFFGFVGLAFVVYRRFRRARNGNYKWGYSQLTAEDARIVHNDYK